MEFDVGLEIGGHQLFGLKVGDNVRFWYAIYVKSRHEFVIREDLAHEEIDTFLPTIQRKRQWKDRKKLVDFPIFPGYLFVQLEPRLETFTKVVKTRGVVRLLAAERGFPTTVPDHEIDSLRILLANGDDFDIFPGLQAGANGAGEARPAQRRGRNSGP